MINIKLTDILDTGYNFTKNLPIGLNIASLLFFIFFSVAAHFSPLSLLWRGEGSNLFPFYPYASIEDGKEGLLATIASDSLPRLTPDGGIIREGFAHLSEASEGGAISDINLLEFTQIEVLGHFLYTYASIFLIILSLILLLAMLAIIIISKKNLTNI
jgi:NADH-ubiquinone oxidoreductase chain 6